MEERRRNTVLRTGKKGNHYKDSTGPDQVATSHQPDKKYIKKTMVILIQYIEFTYGDGFTVFLSCITHLYTNGTPAYTVDEVMGHLLIL